MIAFGRLCARGTIRSSLFGSEKFVPSYFQSAGFAEGAVRRRRSSGPLPRKLINPVENMKYGLNTEDIRSLDMIKKQRHETAEFRDRDKEKEKENREEEKSDAEDVDPYSPDSNIDKERNEMINLVYKAFYRRSSVGTVSIPDVLLQKLLQMFKGYNRELLQFDAANLSQLLRNRTRALPEEAVFSVMSRSTSFDVAHNYTKGDTMAYIAHRLPGIYGCIYRVFKEIMSLYPTYDPETMLDFGTGPGTTIWAATQVWDKLKYCRLIEPSESMQEIGKQLLATLVENSPTQLTFEWQRMLYGSNPDSPVQTDLVVASYSLSELTQLKLRKATIRNMWEFVKPGGFMVFIEPGTPVGFEIIREAREEMLAGIEFEQIELVAPCYHIKKCPMQNNSWCHFSQRVERSKLHLSTKKSSNATINWEDEKFSYIIFRKPETQNDLQKVQDDPLLIELRQGHDEEKSRVMNYPLKKTRHQYVRVCSPRGKIETHILTRRKHPLSYKAARKASWGDSIHLSPDSISKTEFNIKGKGSRRHVPSLKPNSAKTTVDTPDDLQGDDGIDDEEPTTRHTFANPKGKGDGSEKKVKKEKKGKKGKKPKNKVDMKSWDVLLNEDDD